METSASEIQINGVKYIRADSVPAPVPVPVSERLPGAEDCDAEGRCWWLIAGCEAWALGKQSSDLTHWLPANALPLPSGEVE